MAPSREPCERNCPDHGRQDANLARAMSDIDRAFSDMRREKERVDLELRTLSDNIHKLESNSSRTTLILGGVIFVAGVLVNYYLPEMLGRKNQPTPSVQTTQVNPHHKDQP